MTRPTPSSSPDLGYLAQRPAKRPVRVLMVCMGNICRSPTAHGVLQAKLHAAGLQASIHVDSAGTHDYHVGEPPDARAQRHALARGYDLSAQRARQLQAADFAHFDLILVMDAVNERAAQALCVAAQRHKLHRLTDFAIRHDDGEVPDPYYGGSAGFEQVLDLVEDACEGVLARLQAHVGTERDARR